MHGQTNRQTPLKAIPATYKIADSQVINYLFISINIVSLIFTFSATCQSSFLSLVLWCKCFAAVVSVLPNLTCPVHYCIVSTSHHCYNSWTNKHYDNITTFIFHRILQRIARFLGVSWRSWWRRSFEASSWSARWAIITCDYIEPCGQVPEPSIHYAAMAGSIALYSG